MKIEVCNRCRKPIHKVWYSTLDVFCRDKDDNITQTGFEDIYTDARRITLCQSCHNDFISFMKEPTYECN